MNIFKKLALTKKREKAIKEYSILHLKKLQEPPEISKEEEKEMKRLVDLNLTYSENYSKINAKYRILRENEFIRDENNDLISLKEKYPNYNFIEYNDFFKINKKYSFYFVEISYYKGLLPENILLNIENNKDFIDGDKAASYFKFASKNNIYVLTSTNKFHNNGFLDNKELKKDNGLNLSFLCKIITLNGREYIAIINYWR